MERACALEVRGCAEVRNLDAYIYGESVRA